MKSRSVLFVVMFALGAALGYGASVLSQVFENDLLTIRVMNDTKCEDHKITVIYRQMSFVVEGGQINREPSLMAVRSDTLIYVPRESEDSTEYSVLMECIDCPSIKSPVRRVTYGHILYEWVREDGQVDHQVRS